MDNTTEKDSTINVNNQNETNLSTSDSKNVETEIIQEVNKNNQSVEKEIEQVLESTNVENMETIKESNPRGEDILTNKSGHLEYRIQPSVVDLSSSDSEPDSTTTLESSSSSSSSESSSSSDSEDDKKDENDDNSSDETEKQTIRNKVSNKEKGEFDDLPLIEDLKISVPEVLADPMGEVAWFVEQMVVVKPKPEKPTLNFDTVLFLEKGSRVLGRVFDVFGPVQDPHYCVRFNSEEHIKENNIQIGMTVYYWPNSPYTTLVFLSELTKMKGVDTNDSEHPEFSDDEEEQAYYAKLRTEKNAKKIGENEESSKEIPAKKLKTKSNTQTSGWHRRSNSWTGTNQNQMYPAAHQTQFMHHQQSAWSQMPHSAPIMPQYQMPQYPYIPNAPYAFGYQNWPAAQSPFFGLPPPPPPPPQPYSGQRMRIPRFSGPKNHGTPQNGSQKNSKQ